MRRLTMPLIIIIIATAGAGAGCGDKPGEVARRELDRLVTLTSRVEVGNKVLAKAVLDVVVADERTKRASELKQAGCTVPANVEVVQSSTLPSPCREIWEAAHARFNGRVKEVADLTAKVDAAVGLVLSTLLVAITVEAQCEAGKASWSDWPATLARLWDVLKAAQQAYEAFKKMYAEVGEGGWQP
jgi:hypothetical protein